LYWKVQNQRLHAKEEEEEDEEEYEPDIGAFREDLPTYTREEIAKHTFVAIRVWTTYKRGVYDITDYVNSHPGGSAKIMLSAGGSLEPFWNMYTQHKTPDIASIAERYRIGNVEESEVVEEVDKNDPYANEPKRNPMLKVVSQKPFNAETPPPLLIESYITPNEMFYVRNHLPAPDIDEAKWFLEVIGPDGKRKCYRLCKLKQCFPKKTTMVTLMCAGDRRSEMIEVKEVKGLKWGPGAIGNAEWTGAILEAVLKDAGIDLDKTDKKHLVFEGVDMGPDGGVYGASIPVELARILRKEMLIAYDMNGESLPRDHGFPARIILPGVVGARQVKWIKKIYLSDEESESHWQRKDYKVMCHPYDSVYAQCVTLMTACMLSV
jgi:sulfite oxidase